MRSRIWLATPLFAIIAGTIAVAIPAEAVQKTPGLQESQPSAPALQAAAGNAAWTTFHNNNARSGYDANEPSFSALGAGWTNSSLIGDIYAEPLVYGGTVYIVTEDNYLYALNYSTGAVQWSKHLSTPMDSSGLPCGNITPHVGITSTPVVDTSLNRIYMVGMVSTAHYVLWGVDLSTHGLVVNHVVDPANADVTLAQGQRGALGLSQGLVYIPYGGRAGDCFSPNGHTYYGIVLGARRTDGAVLYRFQTNGTGAVWASGGESIDSTGHVYISIGNGTPPDSERVFKLNPNLSRQNSFVPANQAALDAADADVGSIIPQLVGGGEVFQSGKHGDGYLLSSVLAKLQGPTALCGGLTSDASFGAAAYLSPYIYVPCTNGLYVYQQTGNTFAFAWSDTSVDASAPIVAGGNVIFIDHALDTLIVRNATTGAAVASAQLGSTTHFGTPATGNGYVYAADIGAVHAYTLLGCTSASMSPDVSSPRTPGATVTFTATSTGCNATPEYEFWLQLPGSTAWTAKTGFGAATWAWNTTGLKPGVYGIGVYVRAVGSTSVHEAYWLGTYTLTINTCATAKPSTIATSPQAPGSPVLWTGTAFPCSNPEFRFYILVPGGVWTMTQDWSTSGWTWQTSGLPTGTYQIGVWARQTGSANTKDAYGFDSFVLGTGSCISTSLSPNPAPPQEPGTSVQFTATSNSCTSPQYEFWLMPPGGGWVVKRAFLATATWTWNTAGDAPGTYQVGVWVKQAGSTKTHDAYYIGTFQLVVGTCQAATILGSPASPQVPGTPVTFTATATTTATACTAPRYEFWELVPPSTAWRIVQPFGIGNTYAWDTTGKSGAYRFGVWVKQNGSTASHDTYAQTTFWVGT